MSGGSFNYIHDQFPPNIGDLGNMVDELDRSFPNSKAHKDSRELLLQLTADNEELRDVWHAIEWWCSNDYGPDQAADAVAKYEVPNNKSVTTTVANVSPDYTVFMKIDGDDGPGVRLGTVGEIFGMNQPDDTGVPVDPIRTISWLLHQLILEFKQHRHRASNGTGSSLPTEGPFLP